MSAVLSVPAQRATSPESFAALVRADAPVYLAILGYTVIGLLWLQITELSHLSSYSIYFTKWLKLFGLIFPIFAVLIHFALLMHRFNRRRVLAAKRVFARRHVARFSAGICLLLSTVFFQGTFTSIKNSLSALAGGFPNDRFQADLDAWLHFGVDPWRLLYAFGKHDWIRVAVEWNYNALWFIICFATLFYVATSSRTQGIRQRYVLCFMLVWIVIGNVLAGLFLSAGPAFYGQVTGDTERFAEQLAFLARGADWSHSAVAYQDYLWKLHEMGTVGFGSGISAFPSVHVGLITMNALFLYDHSKRLGLVAFVYVAFVLASSVYLGWHYAIDGYVAIAVTFALYFALRRWLPNPQTSKSARKGNVPA